MQKLRILIPMVLILLLLLVASAVWASSSPAYSIDRYVLSAGGAPAASSSGQVSLNGTLGQTAAGVSSEGHTTLWTGFWQRIQQVIRELFLPIITHNR